MRKEGEDHGRVAAPHHCAHSAHTDPEIYVEVGKVKPERSIKQSKVSTQARQHTIHTSIKEGTADAAHRHARAGLRE